MHPLSVRSRRLATTLLLTLPLVAGVLGLAPGRAPAARAAETARHVDVVEVSGLFDPVLADFTSDAVREADAGGAEALIIQLDSGGSVVGAATVARVAALIEAARTPVGIWVGPSGASADAALAPILEAADVVGSPEPEGVEGGVKVDLDSPVLGQFIVDLDGRTLGGRTLDTADIVRDDGRPTLEPNFSPRFQKLDLLPRLMHTVASPPVAYLLLTIGVGLLLFELFTGGVGVAGVTGAVAVSLAAYGLTVLPTNPVALALIAVAAFGFAVDIQVGVPRLWTGIACVTFVAGSLALYDEPATLGWLPLVTGVVAIVLLMLGATPAVVRSRFSTPTIGREAMIGELGDAETEIAPDGMIRLHGALWRARTNRATPIAAGDRARVVAIEGVVLEVEPETGGARDYRERAGRH